MYYSEQCVVFLELLLLLSSVVADDLCHLELYLSKLFF